MIATSSGAAAAYVKEGYANMRIGILLEIATTLVRAGRGLAGHPAADGRRGRHVRRGAGCLGAFYRAGRAAPKTDQQQPDT